MSIFKTIRKAVAVTMYSIAATPAIGMMGYAALNWEELNTPVVETEKVITREERFRDVRAKLPDKAGMPVEWLDCIFDQESYGGRIVTKKFEPDQLKTARKITSNEELLHEYASSHGPFQIMGYHVKLELNGNKHDRGDWIDLYEPEFAAEQFIRIMGACRAESQAPTFYEHVKKSSACYNGTGPTARAYGNQVADCVARKAVERLKV